MTYQSFANEGYLLTEAERQAIDATIVEQYRVALQNINDKIGSMLAKAREAGNISERPIQLDDPV